jgi:hypothetical protein
MIACTPRARILRAASRRLLGLFAASAALLAATPGFAAIQDLLPLNTASLNHAAVFNGVKINNTTPEPDLFKSGTEMLSAVYAYLNPQSTVYNNTAYRERLFVLLDHRLGLAATGVGLRDIGWSWQAAYAYMLMKHHRPAELSAARIATYEAGLALNSTAIIDEKPLLYTNGLLAQVWLNGDIRLAMGVYFAGHALGDTASLALAEKARAAIDGVMTKTALADGGTRYVGFWGEVASYHEDTVETYIYWWKITGSPTAKALLDSTLNYSVVSNEPDGFVEQSSNIPYKHMYNNRHNEPACLWKAYLYDDGYNYHFGRKVETSTSTRLLNTILYQPSRQLKTPPANVGVFFDGNIQGPRHRSPTWGWIAHGRDVQNGGPEELAFSQPQGYDGRMCGKATFVGAYALGPVANKTSLKGALDTVSVEFKETPGADTDYNRGTRYRFLTQDEQTRVITRHNFGTLSSTYRVSKRTSSFATPDWSAGATPWVGHQVWVLTPERVIGLVQIVNDAPATIYGLDTRLVFSGGRLNSMGSYLDLIYDPTGKTFTFGELRAKIHAASYTGSVLQQRFGISDPNSADTYSALVRINHLDTAADVSRTFAAGAARHWIVLDITREGAAVAPYVVNVVPGHASFAVLQFTEGARKVRIVQNLGATDRNYTGSFVVGTTYPNTSLHRSWSDSVTPVTVTSGTAAVSSLVPAYGHMIAVNSSQPDDHTNARRTSATVFP